MVVIIGAGIAGVSTAFYLSSLSANDPIPITLVDAVGPAACSSGKAGAFLTSTWGPSHGDRRGSNKRESLFRESFALHQALADELGLSSFRPISACRVAGHEEDPPRGADHGTIIQQMEGPTAMVDPSELTSKLFDKTLESGNAVFQQGTVVDLETTTGSDETNDSRVRSISLSDGSKIIVRRDEDIVIAMGPWSSRIEDWLDVPLPLDGILSTSLIWNNIENSKCPDKAFFCNEDGNGCHLEIFPRVVPGNESSRSIYVSGCGESEIWSPAIFRSRDAPDPREDCQSNQSRAAAALKSLQSIAASTEHLANTGIVQRSPDVIQACIRPTAPDGMPVVGKLAALQNVYVCTGGGPWGITWGPLLGYCLAKHIMHDRTLGHDDSWDENELDLPVRVSPLQPSRFNTLLYRSLRDQRRNSGDKNSVGSSAK